MAFNANILDTSIPLQAVQGGGADAVPVQSPAQLAEERERLRNAKAVADFNTQRASDAQREAQRQALLEQVAAETAGDWDAMETRLAAIDPELGLKVRKGRFDAQRSMHEAFVSRMEEERAGADIMSSFVRMVQQAPDLYPQLRAAIEARLPEDVRAALPAEYDARVLAAFEEAAVPAKEAMARAQKNHELVLKGDWQKGLFGQLADADDEEEYTNIVESYKPFLPAGALAMVPKWSPDAPDKIARIVMGPDAVIDNARADDRDAVLARQGDARVAIAGRRAAQAASGGSGGGSAAAPLVDAVMANPGLFAGMTPTDKAKLIPALQARGFKFDQIAGGDGKPSTQPERASLAFFERAQQAENAVSLIETEIAGKGLAGQTIMEYAPNFLQSEVNQKYRQAQRAFTEARLRKESGAAVPPEEYKNDSQTYFAQPGDTPAVLEQKRRARAQVLAGLAFQSGRALRESYGDSADQLVSEYRARAKGGAAPASSTAQSAGPAKRFTFDKAGNLVEQK